MSFVYPRRITVRRAAIGFAAGEGLRQTPTQIAANIPASIQVSADRSATTRISPGPTDTNDAMPTFNIFIPLNALAKGIVKKGDEIEDDLGDQYVVEAPYWNSLGYRLSTRYYAPSAQVS